MALSGILSGKTNSKVKDWQEIDLAGKIPDVRHLYQQDEPESSSAGFAAGIAVGVVLGIVLSYLFGRSGGREMVDQFVQRADDLKETATDVLYQSQEQAEDDIAAAKGRLEDEQDAGPQADRAVDSASEVVGEVRDAADETQG